MSRINDYILLFEDADQAGIIARISSEIFRSGGNIKRSEQYTSPEGHFFLRFAYRGENISDFLKKEFPQASFSCQQERRKDVVIFVSDTDHCLLDLLWRSEEEISPFRIKAVVSNKEKTRSLVESYAIPFHYIPQGQDRQKGERQILEKMPRADFIVLARYMRILSGDFLKKVQVPLINVHHSFLPAFPGAKPYQKAYQRGVKTIGATAHYVIEELDAGAIISQRTMDVTHRDSIKDLIRKGREEERLVLAEAVLAHAEDRIIKKAGKTIVFTK